MDIILLIIYPQIILIIKIIDAILAKVNILLLYSKSLCGLIAPYDCHH